MTSSSMAFGLVTSAKLSAKSPNKKTKLGNPSPQRIAVEKPKKRNTLSYLSANVRRILLYGTVGRV